MALPDYSIGDHDFIAIQGEWDAPAVQVELDERPGVEGTEVTRIAKRGRPFSLVSQVDAESYAAAQQLYSDYLGEISKDPLAVVLAGISSETLNFKCQVLAVTPIRISVILGAIGNGKNPPSQGWCECRWDLIAIPFEPPAP